MPDQSLISRLCASILLLHLILKPPYLRKALVHRMVWELSLENSRCLTRFNSLPNVPLKLLLVLFGPVPSYTFVSGRVPISKNFVPFGGVEPTVVVRSFCAVMLGCCSQY